MDEYHWNNFIIQNSSPASFLQSWQWGEFQEALGCKIYRLILPLLPFDGGGNKGEGEIGLQALIIVRKLPLGRAYLEIPKGPITVLPSSHTGGGGVEGEGVFKEFTGRLKEIGKQEKAVLARINPPYSLSPGDGESFRAVGFVSPQILLRQREPGDTVLVDLSKTEDELLKNMQEKSRYNLRLAERKGVKVRVATQDKKAFERFLHLLAETSKRDGITSWTDERFWKFREKFMAAPSLKVREGGGELLFPNANAELLVGEYQNQILAAAIIMLYGDSGTYLYAASSSVERNANVPSLVLWEAIKLTKARGKKWYDMWGIAPRAAGENHAWAGITRFKTRYVKVGITGKEIYNLGTHDLVLDRFYYNFFKISKKIFKP